MVWLLRGVFTWSAAVEWPWAAQSRATRAAEESDRDTGRAGRAAIETGSRRMDGLAKVSRSRSAEVGAVAASMNCASFLGRASHQNGMLVMPCLLCPALPPPPPPPSSSLGSSLSAPWGALPSLLGRPTTNHSVCALPATPLCCPTTKARRSTSGRLGSTAGSMKPTYVPCVRHCG